ncbi:hypothetical protein Nepgr_021520 [Nepenthes gracilis]|uniref:peptidyl-tRNA hydrolase n=1 Tax=Nepenthes gracilis TaxID=150966 RepID=A0AAD3XX40_NEPGR|nr:hypothetical protein Nepgr_021520 [Nepenthes gracilis]
MDRHPDTSPVHRISIGNLPYSLGLNMMDLAWLSAILVGAGCLALGYYFGARHHAHSIFSARTTKEISVNGQKKIQNPQALEIERLAEILVDFKMVLVVRNDLKMGKGKIAAQCSHATLGLYKSSLIVRQKHYTGGRYMLILQERAKSIQLPTHVTIDAGRTQIAPNSRTVMAILGPVDMVDDVTGGLKLL